ncbi:hypothetical protein HCN44_008396 [Aphidius gifuensis]|uniref:Ig-like domain-containing protein n=1 Tax=Aphidius gifuensis TaxID=684658 RepID=A0A834XQD2_APHGI|nr:uncharacterized protein LOC122858144 [Aphidius gifuensis]KAF7989722.1 hypothetical protein HCN44_008396 [Aphidius gifuensis]
MESSGSKVTHYCADGDDVVNLKHRDCCDIYCSVFNNKNNNNSYINNRLLMSGRISRTFKIACIILLLSIGFSSVFSSKDIKVEARVPKEAELGGMIDMKCDWEIYGGKSLYSVKWYKDGHEFFRYVPDNHPRIQTFPQPGIKLEKISSRENSIRLMDLSFTSTGQYKCEVSTEGPAFATSFKTGNFTVISLPERGPEIKGLSSHYAVGENVTANCTAWPSIPKANLHWSINGKPVPPEFTVVYPTVSPVQGMGIPSTLGLRLEAEARHFVGAGTVKFRCQADVGSRRFDTEKLVQMAHVNNQRLSASDLRGSVKANACFLTNNNFNLIIITTIIIIINLT